MLQPRIASPLGRILVNSTSVCLRCRSHGLARPFSMPLPNRSFTSASVLRLPASDPNDGELFVPKPLGRPIGFKDPPQPGQNTGEKKAKKDYSGMSLKERNLAKREVIVEEWGTSYFRDFKNITKHRSGKTFMANPRLFRKEAALYFPNFHGETLAEKRADSTNVLRGKVSIVNIYSSNWGEMQVKTFTGTRENPQLAELLSQNPGMAQMVDINIEENKMKGFIITLFQWSLRMKRRREDWGKYFVVREVVAQRIREALGLLNKRVGYVYLLDQDCKIRWAGSANAEGTEAEELVRGCRKLIEDAKKGASIGVKP